MTKELKVLKAVLIMQLEHHTRYFSKEKTIRILNEVSEQEIDELLHRLEYPEPPEELNEEDYSVPEDLYEYEHFYGLDIKEPHICCSAGDYGPSCPWKAPGMSISDFI